jgi:diguanylate cyclase (GGDEF)-like protein
MSAESRSDRSSICGYPPRLFWYAVALIAAAVPLVGAAAAAVVGTPPGAQTALGVVIFFALTVLAELKPVPLDEAGNRLVSLAFIFIVAGQILFGWEFGVLIGAGALLITELGGRTPLLRSLVNASVYAISAFAASLPGLTLLGASEAVSEHRFGSLTALSFVESSVFVALNVILVCLAIALYEGLRARDVTADHLRHSGPAFSIMAFMAALAVALWVVWPPLVVLLAGPLFALALFQRYALRTKVALRAASTDSLTRLKNHRSYESELVEALERASASGSTLALCVIDIDDFKKLNDCHGHPEGDRMLIAFSDLLGGLGDGNQAYRLGGDEFALVVESGEDAAVAAIQRLRSGLALRPLANGEPMTFSAGIACFPDSADSAEELLRVADVALYWTKRHGKDRCCVYSPSVIERSWPAELAATVEYDARLRAAENLIRVVDAKDTYTGSHSQSVAILAEAMGQTMGLPEQAVSQLRLAGLLHDLGKIAVSEAILQKPAALDPAEYAALRRHSEIGFELLEGLDVQPVDLWILHHHEHWDGSGYPLGLRGEEIPIGSRIVLVADAFDAMTTDRSYGKAMTVAEALLELRRQAGIQFDPQLVGVLESALAGAEVDRAAVA